MTLQQVWAEAVTLNLDDRRELIKLLVDTLTESQSLETKHDILEFVGVGAEMWGGVDAQAYVNELREEWDSRP
jgi:hypothetical protein